MRARNPMHVEGTTMQCHAKTRSGAPCRGQAMLNGRCRMHGGATPAGVALPHFRTGRRSRDLPARLAARYQEARSDPQLLELREGIALVDARIADLLARVDAGESGARWRALQVHFRVCSARCSVRRPMWCGSI